MRTCECANVQLRTSSLHLVTWLGAGWRTTVEARPIPQVEGAGYIMTAGAETREAHLPPCQPYYLSPRPSIDYASLLHHGVCRNSFRLSAARIAKGPSTDLPCFPSPALRTSRGVGLEYTRQLLARSTDTVVIATARKPSPPLTELKGQGTLHVLTCDVTDRKSIEACRTEVEKLTDRIDYLFNNAGMFKLLSL